MASLDPEIVRHALATAREHGFAEVELEVGEASFRANLLPLAKRGTKSSAPPDKPAIAATKEDHKAIRSPIVGFYHLGPVALTPGQTVKEGDTVAVITALGIANDVEAAIAGEVVEVCVGEGQPVEYGQVLAKVKV